MYKKLLLIVGSALAVAVSLFIITYQRHQQLLQRISDFRNDIEYSDTDAERAEIIDDFFSDVQPAVSLSSSDAAELKRVRGRRVTPRPTPIASIGIDRIVPQIATQIGTLITIEGRGLKSTNNRVYFCHEGDNDCDNGRRSGIIYGADIKSSSNGDKITFLLPQSLTYPCEIETVPCQRPSNNGIAAGLYKVFVWNENGRSNSVSFSFNQIIKE